jgi:fumarylacetoacetate (FAA) hydrolase
MKLATVKDGSRDGRLFVVNRDLTTAVSVLPLPTLQSALDDWRRWEPVLEQFYSDLNEAKIKNAVAFQSLELAAPLPRAYQWCDGSAYLSHAELVRRARNAEMPASLYSDPLIYQGGSDVLLGAHDDIQLENDAWGCDLEAEIAVIVDDVPMGVSPQAAGSYIRLFMLVNDISLRNLIASELAKQFGFFQSKPPTAFSPVAATADELGDAWDGCKLSLPLFSKVNDKELGHPNAGVDLNFDFPTLIAHAAKTRPLSAGTIVGSGTVSNRDRSAGSSCLQERRMIETIERGSPTTPFLTFGDTVRIDMFDARGQSIFGAIHQKVGRAVLPAALPK